jgi:hypothetical protein
MRAAPIDRSQQQHSAFKDFRSCGWIGTLETNADGVITDEEQDRLGTVIVDPPESVGMGPDSCPSAEGETGNWRVAVARRLRIRAQFESEEIPPVARDFGRESQVPAWEAPSAIVRVPEGPCFALAGNPADPTCLFTNSNTRQEAGVG